MQTQVSPCRGAKKGCSGWAPSDARTTGVSQGRKEAGNREETQRRRGSLGTGRAGGRVKRVPATLRPLPASLPSHHALGQRIPQCGPGPAASGTPGNWSRGQPWNLRGGLPLCLTSPALAFENREQCGVREGSPEKEPLGWHLTCEMGCCYHPGRCCDPERVRSSSPGLPAGGMSIAMRCSHLRPPRTCLLF